MEVAEKPEAQEKGRGWTPPSRKIIPGCATEGKTPPEVIEAITTSTYGVS